MSMVNKRGKKKKKNKYPNESVMKNNFSSITVMHAERFP